MNQLSKQASIILQPPKIENEILDYIQALKDLNEDGLAGPHKVLEDLWDVSNKTDQLKLREYFKWHKADWIDLTCIALGTVGMMRERRFKLFPAQRKLLVDLIEKMDRMIDPLPKTIAHEKSRNVGWTNTLLLCWQHSGQFWGHPTLLGTKDATSGDNKNEPNNSMLPRIRFNCENQPPYLFPDNFDLSLRESSQGKIIFGNGGTIALEATATPQAADKFGRGGRVRYAHLSEAGKWISSYLRLAMIACSDNATFKFLECSAANSDSHEFSQWVDKGNTSGLELLNLTDEELERIGIEKRKGIFVSHRVNPYHDKRWMEAKLIELDEEVIDQEIKGLRGRKSARIIKRFDERTFKNPETKDFWKFNDAFIQRMLNSPGFFTLAFDGGVNGKVNACALGWWNKRYRRRLGLKEFFSEKEDHRDIYNLALRVKDFVDRMLSPRISKLTQEFGEEKPLRLFGDPSLVTYNDHESIQSVFNLKIDLLESLRPKKQIKFGSQNDDMKNLFRYRKTSRIQVLRQELEPKSVCSDNLPMHIFLGDVVKPFYDDETWGCAHIVEGLYRGSFQWKEDKEGALTNEILQNTCAHVVDALSYEILAQRPKIEKAQFEADTNWESLDLG